MLILVLKYGLNIACLPNDPLCKLYCNNIIQLLVFEEPNIKTYRCVKGDVDRREARVNISFLTKINLDIGLFKHQLFNYCFNSSP